MLYRSDGLWVSYSLCIDLLKNWPLIYVCLQVIHKDKECNDIATCIYTNILYAIISLKK